MRIKYVRQVVWPEFLAGEVDDVKEVEEHWARQLIADGYAVREGDNEFEGPSS